MRVLCVVLCVSGAVKVTEFKSVGEKYVKEGKEQDTRSPFFLYRFFGG